MGNISVNVIKKDNRVETFTPQKIVNSCIKAGVKESVAKEVADAVSRKVYPSIPTAMIRKFVVKELGRRDKIVAEKYDKYEKTGKFKSAS
jgi:transcriptional regulator NrdR family protein